MKVAGRRRQGSKTPVIDLGEGSSDRPPAKAGVRRQGNRAPVIDPGQGSPARSALGARLEERLHVAARALDRGYENDAARILTALRDTHPDVAEVRELLGLSLYRLGRWLAARKELEAFAQLTGSTERHPVIMDCARGLRRHTIVERYWDDLRAASPGAAVMAEGRIVVAGSLADRGRVPEAIRLLEKAPAPGKRVGSHNLRLWYALADLHERAGDLPAARALFRKVAAGDPAFVDIAERLAALS